jgi:hypothetical protein
MGWNAPRRHRRAKVVVLRTTEGGGHVQVKGIAYPVATYGVIALKEDISPWAISGSATLPHLRLEIEPELMSSAERQQAVAALRNLADQLDR